MDDWWDVDEKAGTIRGQRTGQKIAIGDVCRVVVARVDMARRELDLSVREVLGREGKPGLPRPSPEKQKHQHPKKKGGGPRGGGRGKHPLRSGGGGHAPGRGKGGGRGKRGRR